LTVAFGAMVPLWPTLTAVTACWFCVMVTFHQLVITWLPGKLNVRVQPLIVLVPALVMNRSAVNPVFQVFGVYRTPQVAPVLPLSVVKVTSPELPDRFPAASRARTNTW